MTEKNLDSRFRGNDIRHFFRTTQQRLQSLAMTIPVAMQQIWLDHGVTEKT
ncbi:hypothetical protein [Rickettsia endosymbiont of Orchestes rusci]|uniref:hypothetical protein n=1 Tax=Rickettsia endosymbiont of Orchestes rusci TaxID=3066250 RepID=UPI00313EA082